MKLKTLLAIILICLLCACKPQAHSKQAAQATYLGNEAVMIEHDGIKILFDPFFHNAFNTYQLVPDDIRAALFSNTKPYNDINAIFISHAHADHFSSSDLAKYLRTFSNTQLIAPKQAIDALLDLEDANDLAIQMHAIELEYQQQAISKTLGNIKFDAVRIPHAGWPQRAGISNLVFRVTLNDTITVVHMGDADPSDVHFKPLKAHWEKQKTNTAFPPYWFFTNADGQLILKDRISADENIGVHVPLNIPQDLIQSKEKFFSEPGEITEIKHD